LDVDYLQGYFIAKPNEELVNIDELFKD